MFEITFDDHDGAKKDTVSSFPFHSDCIESCSSSWEMCARAERNVDMVSVAPCKVL